MLVYFPATLNTIDLQYYVKSMLFLVHCLWKHSFFFFFWLWIRKKGLRMLRMYLLQVNSHVNSRVKVQITVSIKGSETFWKLSERSLGLLQYVKSWQVNRFWFSFRGFQLTPFLSSEKEGVVGSITYQTMAVIQDLVEI